MKTRCMNCGGIGKVIIQASVERAFTFEVCSPCGGSGHTVRWEAKPDMRSRHTTTPRRMVAK